MNRIYEYRRRFLSACLVCLLCLAVYACGQKQDPLEKIRDLEYTVIAEDNIPQELLLKIEERKEDPFKLTFEDQGFLYICVGYGTQQTGGYSIAVNGLYETANAIYIDTNLIGPSPEEKSKQVASYPYVVVKMEFLEKPVVFE
ncbi:MAG: protease complex subunit PrcB family protein [Lachnospiraceae bacterium]|nr:protease complex subunit PrcB family protein [Lachnospiraceae bacterium]